ncbi:MAG: hypothetical protein ACLR0U_08905 [Enterocloster clostridioformis]
MLFTGDMGKGRARSLVRLAEQEETLQDIHLNHAADIENSPSWFRDTLHRKYSWTG